ncbi:hypothetical protein COCSADRAFT_92806 [Bipolaris sorokiniana ND90Pr]|uniref:Cyclin N-terminal domain-containing protein n=1 Tax=Cochliobolus sativus (strain ND90Pr / ATCC 201652) TaxID=665912 RepID=M2R6Z6_COCSN|nr:uncharacterized protein COCSADRAFT_92806 [Bipolaris sorokiniana ND90Pr]EMD62764.1 hypothetical protein COCSADRAFT_92806 [Bipolaris sorokiniana ND90Pr]
MSYGPNEPSQLPSLINYVTERTMVAIRSCTFAPGVEETCLPSIDDFILYVVTRSYTTPPELIMCVVYLSRFQERLPPTGVTMRPSTPHRIFLAALILAHKVYNDDSVNNTCWAECSGFPEYDFAGFSNVEVNLIEKQFLALLNWNVHISADLQSRVGLVTVVSASIGGKAPHRNCGIASPALCRATMKSRCIINYPPCNDPTHCNVLLSTNFSSHRTT